MCSAGLGAVVARAMHCVCIVCAVIAALDVVVGAAAQHGGVWYERMQGIAGACGSWKRWPPSGGPTGPAVATHAPGLGSRVYGSPYEL